MNEVESRREKLRPLYNELARFYEIIEERDYQAEISLIEDVLKRSGAERLIDLGCGTGLHVRELAKRGYSALGIDISRRMIAIARVRARGIKGAEFRLGDYYRFKSKRPFDAALCLNWSIPVTLRDLNRFLANTSRLLRDDGIFIMDYESPGDIVWSDVGKPLIDYWRVEGGLILRVSLGEIRRNVMRSRDVYILFGRPAKFKLPDERRRYLGSWSGTGVRAFLDVSHVRFYEPEELARIAERHGLKHSETLSLETRRGYKRLYSVFTKKCLK